jgi:hypothetical protein
MAYVLSGEVHTAHPVNQESRRRELLSMRGTPTHSGTSAYNGNRTERGSSPSTGRASSIRVVPDAQPDYVEWLNRMAGDAPRYPDYVRLRRSDAIELARQAGRSGLMRILDLDDLHDDGPVRIWTADGRPNRLNMVVRDDTVIAAAMF